MHIKRKLTISDIVKRCQEETDKSPCTLVVTGKDGARWQLKATLQQLAEEAEIPVKLAWKHFMHLAKLVHEGKVDPAQLDAHKIV